MMGNLVTITSKIYDASGKYVINLKVKSRYKGSSRENTNKTDKDGLFIFQGSPNRTVEILAKPPNTENYIVIKTIDSSIISSRKNPVKVSLPKSIEEYHKEKVMPTTKGIVTTLFKIIDCNEKILTSFPVKSRPKGKQSSFERHTNEQGIVEVVSSPNRDIEILVLTSNDEFALKGAVNSKNGSQIPKIIKLDEPYESFKSESNIQIVDREGNNYIVENTKVEIFYLERGRKEIINTSNGKFSFLSMIGEKIQITVFKPDGTPLKSENYLAKRMRESLIRLTLDVDVIKGDTVEGKPSIEKKIDEKILITMEQMQKMWPGVSSEKMQPIMDELNKNLQTYKLDTRLRQAHFFGQIFGEIGVKFILREDISNYTAKNLIALSSYYKKRPKEAEKDAKLSPKNLKIKTITNKWYMDKNRSPNLRLGNIYEGDGYKFLGRGLKQTTGRYNYSVLTEMYPRVWPNDGNPNFTEDPQLLEQSKYAARSAIIFWLDKKLYQIADKGEDENHIDKITRVINLYAPNKEQRKLYFKKARRIFI